MEITSIVFDELTLKAHAKVNLLDGSKLELSIPAGSFVRMRNCSTRKELIGSLMYYYFDTPNVKDQKKG